MAEPLVAVKLDSKAMQAAYAQLKAAGSHLTVDLRHGIVDAAKPLVTAVKEAAPSARIASAVKSKVSFSAKNPSVSIVADSKKAPEAAPINNKGRGGTFRHPVFGTDTWVDQAAVPFFDAPIRAHQGQADAAMVAALKDFERRAGFK